MGGEAYIHLRLTALALAAGVVDAASFLGLDQVFTANQTGNTVLLGIGLSQGGGGAVARPGLALAAFCAGVLLGALALGGRPGWGRRAAVVLGAEALALALVAALWGPAPTLALVAAAALAMGAQSAVTLRLAPAGVTTTFVTGTITRVVGELARGRVPRPEGVAVAALAAYLAGALAGGLLERTAGAATAMAAGAAIVAVAALSAASAPAAARR